MADRLSRSVLEFVTKGEGQAVDAFTKVERQSRQSSQAVTGFGGSWGSLTTAIKGFLALEITQRVIQIAGAVTAAVDEFDTLAGKINDTTDNVQRLKAVSQEYDVSIESLIGGIQELQQRLGDPKDDFVKALGRINTTVDQLKAQAPTEAYLQIADALGRIPDAANRAALAKELLGGTAKQTANAFRENVDQTEAWVTMSADTIAFVDRLDTGVKQLGSTMLALAANTAAGASGWTAWQMAVDYGRETLNALLLDAKNFKRYMDQEMQREGNPSVSSPQGLVPQIQLVRDLTQDEKELQRVEEQLTRTARERIAANGEALKAVQARQDAERAFNEWMGLRLMEDGANRLKAIEDRKAAERAYYEWAHQRYMEDEGRRIESMRRVEQAAAQMHARLLATASTTGMNGTGEWMLRPTVPMNSPNASGGGFWSSLTNSRWGQLLGGGLGMLSGLIPGQSQRGAALGSLAGSFFGPLGGTLGGLAGGFIGRLFGSEAGATKKARNAWVEQEFGSIDELRKQAAAAGVSLDKLFSTKKVKDFEAESKRVMQAIEAHRQKVLGLERELADLEAERDRLQQETEVTYDRMQGLAEQYGINQEGLGKGFDQGRTNKSAGEIIEALDTFKSGGADMGTVLFGMRDELSALVRDAAKAGTEIPENLRPFIEHLLATGNLLDENGEAMKDLPNIKFGEAMASQLSKAQDRLAEVVDKLADVLSQLNALNGKRVSFDVEGTYRGPEGPDDGGPRDNEGYSRGTRGRLGSFWGDFGKATKTVLHGVQAVVRPDQGLDFARSVLAAHGTTGDGLQAPLVVAMDGKVAARAMVRYTGRTLAVQGA